MRIISKEALAKRYERIYKQLKALLTQTEDKVARMATVAALLHHKMPQFSWTGFYLLKEGDLIVGPYQGPLACQVLEKERGVCWAALNSHKTIIVPDVNKFPGHIACDPSSKSEIAVPIFKEKDRFQAVLDVDSHHLGTFSEIDKFWLEKVVELL